MAMREPSLSVLLGAESSTKQHKSVLGCNKEGRRMRDGDGRRKEIRHIPTLNSSHTFINGMTLKYLSFLQGLKLECWKVMVDTLKSWNLLDGL
jgi:hypothetical protein